MRHAGIVAALAAVTLSAPASGSNERQIVYYSIWGDCIGNPHTPLCALDTLLSCMVRDDRALCASVGAAGGMNCRITGVRYIVDRLSETSISFRASVCRDDRPCPAPATVFIEELERTDGAWRFRAQPQIHAQACRP